jgi:hypothetical protein
MTSGSGPRGVSRRRRSTDLRGIRQHARFRYRPHAGDRFRRARWTPRAVALGMKRIWRWSAAHQRASHRAGSSPHRWLLPRMAVVVHHGGAGTAHAVARWRAFGRRPLRRRSVLLGRSALPPRTRSPRASAARNHGAGATRATRAGGRARDARSRDRRRAVAGGGNRRRECGRAHRSARRASFDALSECSLTPSSAATPAPPAAPSSSRRSAALRR